MLLRFSVSNFGSIRDKQELSMIASGAIKDDASGLIDAPELKKEKVLPAAVIYGANASGKSNFVKALAHMQMLVRDSHRRGEPGGGVPLKPFLLDPDYVEKSSAFSMDFVWKGARYAYGFEACATEVLRETLAVWRGGSRAMLFERERDVFEFGRSLKGENRVTEKLTRPNSLFLSAAAQNNHETLRAVAAFFADVLVEKSESKSPGAVALSLAKEAIDERMIGLLCVVDIGVTGIHFHKHEAAEIDDGHLETERNTGGLKEDMSALEWIAEKVSQANRRLQRFENHPIARLGRKSKKGEDTYLSFSDESAGTLQLLSILGPVFRALDEGRVVVIDEFGSRLHTRASELILALFNNKETNPEGAQLIVATHDTNLLNAKGLRRDQVWFTEKDETGATHLYPLTDIETRKGDNLERGYLQGRYGAIPFAGSIADFKKTV